MQFMLLLENAAALLNLHKLYNSLSLFIKSLSNILAYGSKRGKKKKNCQISVQSNFPFPHSHLFIYLQKGRLFDRSP